MHLLKRALSLCVTCAMLVTVISPVAGAVAETETSSTAFGGSNTEVQLHPFSSTEELIRDAVEELHASGVTQPEKESDKELVTKVENTTDIAYDTVKAMIATELKAAFSEGEIDVTEFDLTKEVISGVMAEILEENYLYNAVTNVSYITTGSKVTSIKFDVTAGYEAAMTAMETELEPVKVDADEAAALTASLAAADEISKEEPQATTFSLKSNNAGVAVVDETEQGGNNSIACTYHTVGVVTIGDFNEDGFIDIGDVVTLRNMITADDVDWNADINDDGKVDNDDVIALRNAIVNENLPKAGSGEISYTWVEAQDYTPKFRTNEMGEFLDEKDNVTADPAEAILNGGLIYNPQDGTISEGILADIYWKLTGLDFTCSACGEEVHLIDDPNTAEDELANFSITQDIYINMKTYESVACNAGEKPVLAEGESESDYMLYTDMQIAMYYDDSFYAGLTPVMNENGEFLNDKGEVVENPADAAFMPSVDENGNYIGLYTSEPKDNGASEVAYYYSILSAFNADKAEYFGISSDYWTSKNTEANPMAALKVLCNLDPNMDIPPAQMIQMVQMLPQAFMAYVHYYGAELLAMRDAAMTALEKAGGNRLTDVQKHLVIHDWIAENVVFDMGSMLNISGTGGGNDPIQMTTFGALLSNQLSTLQNSEYYGGICLAYAAAYNYLVQAAYPEIYATEDGEWCTPEQVDANGGDIVDFNQVMFYCDTAETSIAGEGFGGGAFNNVHYFNAVRLEDAPQDPAAGDMTGEWFYVDACYDDIYVECLSQYRAEAEGSVYHSYFLVSPQTMGKIWGDSIDYIDSLHDGYTYIPQVDEYGNVIEVSNNIAVDSPSYDATHPEYRKVEAAGEIMNNNTCYEDSWFSGAISKIYTDGSNWYYVDSESNSSSYSSMMDDSGNLNIDVDQMAQNGLFFDAMMHSNRVGEENQDKLKTRSMSAPDWWQEENTGNAFGFDMTNKVDTYATVLFDYGTGAVRGTITANSELLAAIEEDFIYNEQFPGLTHSIAMSGSDIYFNLGNQIWKTTSAGEEPVLFREYNTVSATSDNRPFKASSYTMDAAGTDLIVENNPIAAICLRTTYTPLYNYVDANGDVIINFDGSLAEGKTEADQANIVGRSFVMMYPAETYTVNIGTNYTFSSAFDESVNEADKMASVYTKEAINYNPDYHMGLSDDSANANEEFLWCANIREEVSPANWVSSVDAEDQVSCTAKVSGHSYVYNEAEKMYICSECNLHAANIINEVEHAEIMMTAITDSGMTQDFINNNNMGSGSTTTQPVSPAREAAITKTSEITITVIPEEGYGFPVASYTAAEGSESTELEFKKEIDEEGNSIYTAVIAEAASGERSCLAVNVELGGIAELTIAEAEGGVVSAVAKTPEAEVNEPMVMADLSVAEGQTGTILVGDEITVTAIADDGYVLKSLEASYTDSEGASLIIDITGSGVFVMPDADVIITAEFEVDPEGGDDSDNSGEESDINPDDSSDAIVDNNSSNVDSEPAESDKIEEDSNNSSSTNSEGSSNSSAESDADNSNESDTNSSSESNLNDNSNTGAKSESGTENDSRPVDDNGIDV